MQSVEIKKAIKELPKIELHIHLEGSIPPSTMLELVKKYEPNGKIQTIEDLMEKISFNTFDEFINSWYWHCTFIREYEDFELISFKVLERLHEQNVKYAEIHYSPPDFFHLNKMEMSKITEAVLKGANEAKNKFGILSHFICDFSREYGEEQAFKTLDIITPYLKTQMDKPGVIAFGLGGPEKPFPPKLYKNVFSEAKKRGFESTIHAGEVVGTCSYIWEAMQETKASRIGHGIECIKDEKLMEYLKKYKIPLEISPTSNVRTGQIDKYENHPIRKMFDYGLNISINSDDPLFFGRGIEDEMIELHKVFGFSLNELKQLTMNALNACFLNEEEKEILKKQFF